MQYMQGDGGDDYVGKSGGYSGRSAYNSRGYGSMRGYDSSSQHGCTSRGTSFHGGTRRGVNPKGILKRPSALASGSNYSCGEMDFTSDDYTGGGFGGANYTCDAAGSGSFVSGKTSWGGNNSGSSNMSDEGWHY